MLYDTNLSLLTSGILGAGFKVTSASAAVWDLADDYLDAVAAQGTNLTADAVWLDSVLSTGQEQMTHRGPEPSTLMLFGVALAGLAAKRSRGRG